MPSLVADLSDVLPKVLVQFPHKERTKIALTHTSLAQASHASDLWTRLDLAEYSYGVDDAAITAALDAAAACHGQIEHINLQRCIHVTDQGLRHVAKRCRALKSLEIDGTVAFRQGQITDAGIEAVMESCHHLETIRVCRTSRITDATLRGFSTAPCTPRLTTLDLTGNLKLSDDGVASLSACSSLRDLTLTACRGVSSEGITRLLAPHSLNLHSLHLDGCHHIGDAALEAVCGVMGTLRALTLDGCYRITDAGLQALAQSASALPQGPALAELSLDGCRLVSMAGVAPLVEASSDTVQMLSLLKLPKLKAQDTVQLVAKLPQLTKLRKGMLNDAALAAVVDACPNLEVLDLSASNGNAKISDQGLQAVGRLRHLRELNVSGLHTCTGVVFKVVRRLPFLESLDLRGTAAIATSDVIGFLDLLRNADTCSNLSFLTLSMYRLDLALKRAIDIVRQGLSVTVEPLHQELANVEQVVKGADSTESHEVCPP